MVDIMGRLYSKQTSEDTNPRNISPSRAYVSFSGKKKTYRKGLLFLAAFFVISSLLTAFLPNAQDAAAKTEKEMVLAEKALSYATLNTLRLCMRDEVNQQADNEGFVLTYLYVNNENATAGNWWRSTGNAYWGTTDGAARPGSYLNDKTRSGGKGGDGKTLCNDVLKTGLSLWGYTSALDLLCDAGVKRVDGSPCKESTERFGSLGDYADAVYNAVKKKVYNNQTPDLYNSSVKGYPARYLLYQAVFTTGCQATPSSTNADAKFVYNDIKVIDESGKEETVRYVGGVEKSTSRPIYVDRDNLNEVRKTCAEIASEINTYAPAYKAYRIDNKDEPTTPDNGAICNANPSDPACVANTGSTNCAVEGIGWIVCPVVNFLAGISDAIYGIISQFLEINVKILETNGGAYSAWSIMRNFANVFLVIAFIFIIYSQLTGMGVSNYGIKKTLPRLIIVAILMNISFFVCQLAVDLSNILGTSLKGFLSGLPVFQQHTGNWAEDTLSSGNFFTNIAVSFLGGQVAGGVIMGIAVTGYFFGLGIFIPLIIAVIVAILITFFILLARQMLVVVLIVTAPLAFAALILPNTEKWGKWWQKMFIALLLIYPAIALLFGGSQLAANILIQVGPTDLGWQMAAAAIAIIPLFLVPAMLKGSLNAVPAAGNLVQKLQSKSVGGARKGTAAGVKRLGEFSASKNSTRFGRGMSKAIYGSGMMGRLRQASAKRSYEEPRMKDLMSQWTSSENGEDAIANNPDALSAIAVRDPSSFKGQAAISLLGSQGDAMSLSAVRAQLVGDPTKMAAYNKAIASSYGTLKSKNPSAVQDMVSRKADGTVSNAWDAIKQTEMHGMKDGAILEGIKTSRDIAGPNAGPTPFESTLKTALQDPEQERHFTDGIYKKMGVTRPSILAKQASSGGASSPQATVASQASTQANGQHTIPQQLSSDGQPKLDAYDLLNAQRSAKTQATKADTEMSGEWQNWHEEQAARTQPGIPASQAQTTINDQGQSQVVGQAEDTNEKLSK